MSEPAVYHTTSEEETVALGERLGRVLPPGRVILLYGQLGAGKTALVRGLAAGAGASPEEVSSPTFTIVQQYAGRDTVLYHVDLYRLEPAEIDDLGLEELLEGPAIVAIEWADRWKDRPPGAIEISLEDAAGHDENGRRILVRGLPPLIA